MDPKVGCRHRHRRHRLVACSIRFIASSVSFAMSMFTPHPVCLESFGFGIQPAIPPGFFLLLSLPRSAWISFTKVRSRAHVHGVQTPSSLVPTSLPSCLPSQRRNSLRGEGGTKNRSDTVWRAAKGLFFFPRQRFFSLARVVTWTCACGKRSTHTCMEEKK